MKFVPGGPRKDYCPYCKGDLTGKHATEVIDFRVVHSACRREHLAEQGKQKARHR